MCAIGLFNFMAAYALRLRHERAEGRSFPRPCRSVPEARAESCPVAGSGRRSSRVGSPCVRRMVRRRQRMLILVRTRHRERAEISWGDATRKGGIVAHTADLKAQEFAGEHAPR